MGKIKTIPFKKEDVLKFLDKEIEDAREDKKNYHSGSSVANIFHINARIAANQLLRMKLFGKKKALK